MLQIVTPSRESDKTMKEPGRFRISHVTADRYWTGEAWGDKTAAAIYTREERDCRALPAEGVWELVASTPVRRPFDRAICAQTIAQLLLSQFCSEEGVALRRLNELDRKEAERFIDAGEFITNMTLSPDRTETAVLAMADAMLQGGFLRAANIPSIFEVSRSTQRSYLAQAQSALNAFRENVKEVPPDPHYREQLCRLLDVVAPKPAEVSR